MKEKFLRYLNNKETDECINMIKEEIKLMMYNKKQICLKNQVKTEYQTHTYSYYLNQESSYYLQLLKIFSYVQAWQILIL